MLCPVARVAALTSASNAKTANRMRSKSATLLKHNKQKGGGKHHPLIDFLTADYLTLTEPWSSQ